MQQFVWILIAALVVLHQDNWLWDDATLIFGVLPVGLAYHACLSLAAGGAWYLASRYCWPAEMDSSVAAEAGQGPRQE